MEDVNLPNNGPLNNLDLLVGSIKLVFVVFLVWEKYATFCKATFSTLW